MYTTRFVLVLCNNNQTVDEFYYLMECKIFDVKREQYLSIYFCKKKVSVLKFETLLNSQNIRKKFVLF